MDIKNARDLSKIITLCRKKGVQTIKVAQDGSIEFTLSHEAPTKTARHSKKRTADEAETAAEQYTDEQILMWSSGGVPNPTVEEN